MIPKSFHPMKPYDLKGNLEGLVYPALATPKYDGIRFVTVEDKDTVKALSNSLKSIRNKIVQSLVSNYLPPGLDGEIFLIDSLSKPLEFYQTSGFVMSENKTLEDERREGEIVYGSGTKIALVVFDYWLNPSDPYTSRLEEAKKALLHQLESSKKHPFMALSVTPTRQVLNLEDSLKVHTFYTSMGYEGTVFRSPSGHYKFNRSTLKEQYSLKMKPFEDSEATIVDFEPWFENLNESTLNERGLKEKSKTLESRVAQEWLGSLVVDCPEFGTFKIGTGFNQAQRLELWNQRETLRGHLVKFKYMRAGVKDKPRHPVFLGLRDLEDM